MSQSERIRIPMDPRLRRRGVVVGAMGFVMLFGSAIALLIVSMSVVALLILMALGVVLLVVAYMTLRLAEREALKRSPPSPPKT